MTSKNEGRAVEEGNSGAGNAADGREAVRPCRPIDADPDWWSFLGPVGTIKILVLAALMTWLYWDHFYRLYKYWQQPDWSHGFLLPLFCLYLVSARRRELLTGEHRGSLAGLPVMIGSLVVYAVSIRLKITYPQPLSIVTMIGGLVLFLRGWRTFWLTLFPICFLILAIPPPEYMYREITQPLQQGAAAASTFLLNAFPGTEVENSGINIQYFMDNGTTGEFTVAGACSGMRSLMAFVALGLALAYMTPRAVWQRVLMAVVVVPVALFCNILRVIFTGSMKMYGHEELATGTAHTILGFAVFGLGFMIYMGILWVLDHLFVEVSDGEARDSGAPAGGEA